MASYLDVRDYWAQKHADKYEPAMEDGFLHYFFKEGTMCNRVTCDKRVVWNMRDYDLRIPTSVSFNKETYIVVVSDHDKGLEFAFNGAEWILARILQYESEPESEYEIETKARGKDPGMVSGQHPEVWPVDKYGKVMGFEGYVSQDEYDQFGSQHHKQAHMGTSDQQDNLIQPQQFLNMLVRLPRWVVELDNNIFNNSSICNNNSIYKSNSSYSNNNYNKNNTFNSSNIYNSNSYSSNNSYINSNNIKS
ncbi:hypothetical protein MACK_002364 [Theileria orientalis]|uniref:Uncharacterized protein n=1 Tax=Theileria orientalis TaxID=68886 RepID=A0A976MBI7_THEOR|nr:hypothetical protein MACK_002364 [Theileria orientalis]